jgi:hypothetical protein
MVRSDNEQLATATLIAEGRAALLAGEKPRAQALLQAAVRKEPDNVEAWLWLGGAHTAPEDIAYCLRKVLLLDPGHEQAHEGLVWLAQTHGVTVPAVFSTDVPSTAQRATSPQRIVPAPAHAAPPARTVDERQAERIFLAAQAQQSARAAAQANAAATIRAWDMAMYVGGAGAIVGILRLLGTLRPATMVLVRGSAGPLGSVDAFVLTLGTALVHALALLLGWLALALALGRARNDRQGAMADTLERTGSTLLPGYVLLGGVVLAALSLGWSEQRWLVVVGLVWATMLISAVLIWRRMAHVLDLFRISKYRRTLHVIRLLGPALIIAGGGFVVAGLVMRALLRAL